MPVVPKFVDGSRLSALPELRTEAAAAPFAAAASQAGALAGAGRALQGLGADMYARAQAEREEDERVEFMKLRALREAEAEGVVRRESESDDYQTLDERVMSAMADYDKKTAAGIRGKRMQKLYGNLVEVGNASLAPKLAAMREKRRTDVLSADALLAVNTAVENKRWEDAVAYIENTPDSVWDRQKKAQLTISLEKSRKDYETVTSAQAEARRLLEKYGADGLASALADVRDAHEGKEEDVYLGYVNSLFADAKQERNALYKKTRGELAELYLKSGGLNGVDLQALVDAGRLDAEGALMWSERMSADRERRAAAADRAANKAYRDAMQEDRLFKLSLRGLAPIQQELLEASHYSKMPVEWYVNNYEKALKGVADGSFNEDALAGMKAYGMLVDTHEKELTRKLRERDSSPRALQIQLNCAAQFREKMKKLKIKDDNGALADRFNYDYETFRKKNGGFVSHKDANKMMDDILGTEVIGQTLTWWGGVRDVAMRRGEIAPGAERGADGKWYVTDADGKKHELIFPNAPKLLSPSEAKEYEGMPRPMR